MCDYINMTPNSEFCLSFMFKKIIKNYYKQNHLTLFKCF